MNSKVAAIHQPNFCPWLGYFYKLSQSDIFVILDHVPFSKGSFTPRVRINSAQGTDREQWITIPVRKHPLGTPISDIVIDRSKDFEENIIGKLTAAYRDAPYFSQMIDFVSEQFRALLEVDKLSEFNTYFVVKLLAFLDIKLTYVKSSDLAFDVSHYPSLVDICHAIEATKYWSGKGGQKYQVEEMFRDEPIEIGYIDIQSEWEKNPFPDDFKYKSVLTYMAHYSQETLQQFFRKDGK